MSLEPSQPEMSHMTQPGPLPVGYVSKVPHDGSISEKDFRPHLALLVFLCWQDGTFMCLMTDSKTAEGPFTSWNFRWENISQQWPATQKQGTQGPREPKHSCSALWLPSFLCGCLHSATPGGRYCLLPHFPHSLKRLQIPRCPSE